MHDAVAPGRLDWPPHQETRQSRWKVINLPALSEDAEERPLWPGRWTREQLLERRAEVGEYTWASLYQGRPRPRGGSVFGDPHFWTQLPRHFRVGRGCDLAYTAKTSADASVLVTLLHGSDGYYYVLDVKREQVRAPGFVEVIKRGVRKFASSTPIWFYRRRRPLESGAADLIKALGLRQLAPHPRGGRQVCPRGAARRRPHGTPGKVLVPADSERFEWVDDFVEEFVNFTGTPGGMDDEEWTATVGAFDSLAAALRRRRHQGPKGSQEDPGLPQSRCESLSHVCM